MLRTVFFVILVDLSFAEDAGGASRALLNQVSQASIVKSVDEWALMYQTAAVEEVLEVLNGKIIDRQIGILRYSVRMRADVVGRRVRYDIYEPGRMEPNADEASLFGINSILVEDMVGVRHFDVKQGLLSVYWHDQHFGRKRAKLPRGDHFTPFLAPFLFLDEYSSNPAVLLDGFHVKEFLKAGNWMEVPVRTGNDAIRTWYDMSAIPSERFKAVVTEELAVRRASAKADGDWIVLRRQGDEWGAPWLIASFFQRSGNDAGYSNPIHYRRSVLPSGVPVFHPYLYERGSDCLVTTRVTFDQPMDGKVFSLDVSIAKKVVDLNTGMQIE